MVIELFPNAEEFYRIAISEPIANQVKGIIVWCSGGTALKSPLWKQKPVR
jgi:hypothetical protein